MSPVSRGRRGKSKKNTGRSTLTLVPDTCDCPSCSGAETAEVIDPAEVVDDLMAGAAAELLTVTDPLEAEMIGAMFVSFGDAVGDGFEEALVSGFIPEFEARGTAEALALLLAIGAVTDGRAAKATEVAAERLADTGLTRPAWAARLAEPVTVHSCVRIRDTAETASLFAASFRRGEHEHAMAVFANHLDCGAAHGILLLEAGHLPAALEMMRTEGFDGGVEIVEETLDPADFRWWVEQALDARAVHDEELSAEERADLLEAEDEEAPPYPVLAALVRARIRALPPSDRPPAQHVDARPAIGMLQTLMQPRGRERKALPGPSGKTARVYRLKVSLRGTTPPIWRSLDVPADTTLANLHLILQSAFGWEDSHLHVFETPYGDFGRPNTELGHRSEAEVTVGQVAPRARSKFSYTYDFGDDWVHDIVVEKAFDRDPMVSYPRCVDGRRAAPPDDCGGVWGYAELVETLRNPTDPDHADRLDWMGLETAADFDPERFDAAEVTRALSV